MITTSSSFFDRIRLHHKPEANPSGIIVCGQARFTLLMSRLIRLEWTTNGIFEDRGSYAFPTRYADVPSFTYEEKDETIEIHTDHLTICYSDDGKPFSADNLSIHLQVNGQPVEWKPGMADTQNLRGTRRTLDQLASEASLDEGLLSRSGWALFNDSGSVVWDHEQTWVEARPDEHVCDWYFFGYGHDYKAALLEYVRFGGAIPLVPRYVLGAWWSRFWAYSDEDLKQLVRDFQSHHVPLDVLVVDMDWHTPVTWTGYSWNRDLFPDPEGFLKWVHEQGLFVTFNLHPAQGVQKHEDIYPEFARQMGKDPATGETIQFSASDKRFIEQYFALLHHPMEEQGVDFWWIDWQQGTSTEVKNLDPLPWLNHLHFRDSVRRGTRPMLYSRWGGLGNHRYPIGFSGDAYTTWEALAFQPYFTATAANVGYGWWSHDIGGHFGAADPELYARWVQFGAVSPCLRLHATKDPLAERRPWAFPEATFQAARAAIQLRYQLLPYFYSMARQASERGLSLCYPMYYECPESDDAYLARNQYFIGDSLMAAPIVHPADPQTGLAAIDVWIPEGEWFEYTTLEAFNGPRWVRLYGDLNRIPVFAKSGAIVPTIPGLMQTKSDNGSKYVLIVFPGAEGHFDLYEDDGLTEGYQKGEYETTSIHLSTRDGSTRVIKISGAKGNCPGLAPIRNFEVRLRGMPKPESVIIHSGKTSYWAYDTVKGDVVITMLHADRRMGLEVIARWASAPLVKSNPELVFADVATLIGNEQRPATFDEAFETACKGSNERRAAAIARLGGPFAHIIDYTTYEFAHQQLGTIVISPPADESAFDAEIEWELQKDGAKKRFEPIHLKNSTKEQILNSPFRDDGTFASMRWSVTVKFSWRGQPFETYYESRDAYPAISHWKTLIYNPEMHSFSLQDVVTADGVNGSLAWEERGQSLKDAQYLNQPYGLILLENEQKRIQNGEPLAAYVTAILNSAASQEAVLHVQHVGEINCFLNGVELQRTELGGHSKLDPMFYSWITPQQDDYVLPLREGANQLVVLTRPDVKAGWWTVGATVFDQAGKVLM